MLGIPTFTGEGLTTANQQTIILMIGATITAILLTWLTTKIWQKKEEQP